MVYDLETVADLDLFQRIKYPDCTAEEARDLYKAEQVAKGYCKPEADVFIPSTFHYPVSCVVLTLDRDFIPTQAPVALAQGTEDEDRPGQIAADFWSGVRYHKPIFVDFNGRGFDLPVMVMRALELGIPCAAYFAPDRFGYRYRYTEKHIDLQDWITGYGAFRLTGGLDLCAKLTGGLGKTGTCGSDVERLWNDGEVPLIDSYCRQDVIDTYRLFLRTRVLTGELPAEREAELNNHELLQS
jgi:predicted PolB exonuclease-like 3'-5' exonuclease